MTHDVVVVGAGPAGAIAAAELARAGRAVALVDRPETTPDRIGETLPGAAVRALRRLGLPAPGPGGPHRPVRGALSAWGGPPTVQDALLDPDGPAWRLDRARFEAELRTAATGRGVDLVEGWFRTVVQCADGRWAVSLDSGRTLSAPWLIDATGRRSRVARAMGERRTADSALIAIWALAAPRSEGTDRTLIESAPDGWWYAVRLPDDRALAAFHTAPRTAAELLADPSRWVARLAETVVIAGELDPARFARPMLRVADAKGGRLSRATGAGWVACGDAALSFDPLASQGLLNAVATGSAGAHVVLDPATSGRYSAMLERVHRVYAARARNLYRLVGCA